MMEQSYGFVRQNVKKIFGTKTRSKKTKVDKNTSKAELEESKLTEQTLLL